MIYNELVRWKSLLCSLNFETGKGKLLTLFVTSFLSPVSNNAINVINGIISKDSEYKTERLCHLFFEPVKRMECIFLTFQMCKLYSSGFYSMPMHRAKPV